MENIGIVCFAACYLLALVPEGLRKVRPSGWNVPMEIGLLLAGVAAHSAFLYYRIQVYERLPLSSQQDWVLVVAWVFACLTLVQLSIRRERCFSGPLVVWVLILTGVARFVAGPETYAYLPASRTWGMVHGVSMLLATISILLGFLSGIMYLIKAASLKKPGRKHPLAKRLPSLEWLYYANRHSRKFTAVMLGLGVLSGLVLFRFAELAGDKTSLWKDGLIVGTMALLAWYLVSLLVGHFWRRSHEGHQVAYRTIAGFLALCLLFLLAFCTEHRHNRAVEPRQPLEIPASSESEGGLR
ncbi:MAG: hypothetical protein Q4D98_08640 [Planctomycetia bacterium]|nr:hypothetical protein [Planctomycetia bacterium]